MIRLAIESSTECCSVALGVDGEVRERQAVEPRAHAQRILPWARELLDEAEIGFANLDGLVVSRGPGGFTSLRIGLGIVQGLALAHDLPVHPVSSLDALAQAADPDRRITHLLALLDARMGEAYAAWFSVKDDQHVRIGDEVLLPPGQLQCPSPGTWQAVGPGTASFHEILEVTLGSSVEFPSDDAPVIWPTARALLALADTTTAVPGHQITPTYLRDQVTG